MIISAIIAEYNPFHNGHLLQITQTKQLTKCDYLIVILSGSITQRCTPGIISKWDRAKSAILAGADLVIELPAPFSCATAQKFSNASVHLLDMLGIIDYLSFGSESGDIDELTNTARVCNSEETKQLIYENLKSGISYASARQLSVEKDKSINIDVIGKPNNILAIEYLIALKNHNSKIKPIAIKRTTAMHYDENPSGIYASATYLRDLIINDLSCSDYLPKYSLDIIKTANISSISNLNFGVMSLLRNFSISSFANRPEISEGLDRRICKYIYNATNFDELINLVTTKRYPSSRIRRAIMYTILNVTKPDMEIPLDYLRILAIGRNGKNLINIIKDNCDIKIVTKPSSAKDLLSESQMTLFNIESRATDFYGLCCSTPLRGGQNLTSSPFIES